MDSYTTTGSRVMFGGKIIDVIHDTVIMPDGKEVLREVVVHGGAAAILPIDPDGNIVFVRQYRHPAKNMVLEIPAGTLEPNEDPLVCATRELEEETSFIPSKMTFLFKIYTAIGFCTEVIHIYLAEDLIQGTQNLDEDEFVSIETYSLDDAMKMVFDGEIIDSKTIAAIFAYKQLLTEQAKQ